MTPAIPAAALSSGTQHFVDCGRGSDGDGSRTHPWNTLQAADLHAPYSPGDSILLRRGRTCRGQLSLWGSGTARRPITLGAFGKGTKPQVSGGGTADGTGAVQIVDSQYWHVQDLHVTNFTSVKTDTAHRSGILLINRTAHRLRGLSVEHTSVSRVSSFPWIASGMSGHRFGGISAITVSSKPGAGFDHLRITSNQVTRVGRSGIVVWNDQAWNSSSRDTDVRISGNIVTRAAGDSILLAGARSSRIDHNTAADGSNLPACPIEYCPDGRYTATAGIWPIYSQDLRIDHNEAYGIKWGPGDGEGFDIDNTTRNVVFEYNYAHDNQGGGLLFCGSSNVQARFNIFENNAKSALVFIGSVPATNTSIYNNTIYQSKASNAGNVRYFNGAHGNGIRFFNNLVYNYSKSSYYWPTKPWSRSNTYVGIHKPGEPHGQGYSRKDPKLNAPGKGGVGADTLRGYIPRRGSSVLPGISIPSTITTDFFGKKIDSRKPPRGAAG